MQRTIRLMCIELVLQVASPLIPTAARQNVRGSTQGAREPRPFKAVKAILKAFDNYRIVAIGEVHRNQSTPSASSQRTQSLTLLCHTPLQTRITPG